MSHKQDAIITWASGDAFCSLQEFEVYLRSLQSCGFQGQRFALTHELNQQNRIKLQDYGFIIVDITGESIIRIVRDRFLAFWKFLSQVGSDFRYVIFTDSKDVVFQNNPIEFLERKHPATEEFLLLSAEGMKHSESPWNQNDQAICQKHNAYYLQPFMDWPIVNGGFQAGTPAKLRDFFFLLWSNCVSAAAPCTDQAMMNYLYSHFADDPSYRVSHPLTDSLIATGEAIAHDHLKPAPYIQDGKIMHPLYHDPYFLVHQWERTSFRDEVAAQYGITMGPSAADTTRSLRLVQAESTAHEKEL